MLIMTILEIIQEIFQISRINGVSKGVAFNELWLTNDLRFPFLCQFIRRSEWHGKCGELNWRNQLTFGVGFGILLTTGWECFWRGTRETIGAYPWFSNVSDPFLCGAGLPDVRRGSS